MPHNTHRPDEHWSGFEDESGAIFRNTGCIWTKVQDICSRVSDDIPASRLSTSSGGGDDSRSRLSVTVTTCRCLRY